MAKFTFRLATLLRMREATRDQRREQLAEAYHVDDVLQGQLDGVGQQMQILRDCRRRIVEPGGVDVDQLVETQRYELALTAQQRQIEQQREALAAEIERRREALVEANREVRVLEKLREKQLEKHRHEQGRRDIKQLDEVAQQRAVREMVQ